MTEIEEKSWELSLYESLRTPQVSNWKNKFYYGETIPYIIHDWLRSLRKGLII